MLPLSDQLNGQIRKQGALSRPLVNGGCWVAEQGGTGTATNSRNGVNSKRSREDPIRRINSKDHEHTDIQRHAEAYSHRQIGRRTDPTPNPFLISCRVRHTNFNTDPTLMKYRRTDRRTDRHTYRGADRQT